MDKKSSYLFSADVIRAVAILGVVSIHSIIAVYARPDFFNGLSWWFAIILDSIFRSSVPLFILLSGFLILAKEESFESSLKRTVNRIFIPLVFWIFIYNLYNTRTDSVISSVLLPIPQQIFTVNVNILYFLIIMIGLYIFSSPVSAYLHKVNIKSQRNIMMFFLGLGALYAALQYLFKECSSETILTMWIPYLGLFISGFVLGRSNIDRKKGILSILFIIGLTATILLNFLHFYFLFTKNFNFLSSPGCISHYSDYYLSINVLLMSIPAFLLLLNFNFDKIKSTILGKFIKSISKASFGIFLIHILVIQILDSNFHLFDPIAPAWLYVVIKISVVFLISYILAIIILKIPVLNRIVGAKD